MKYTPSRVLVVMMLSVGVLALQAEAKPKSGVAANKVVKAHAKPQARTKAKPPKQVAFKEKVRKPGSVPKVSE